VPDSEAHRRNYLFRIATNLVHDRRRRHRVAPPETLELPETAASDDDVAGRVQRREDLARGMARLSPRERDLLWLAYAQGSSHREIADVLGLRIGSVKQLLFRARRRLAGLLRGAGAARQPGGGS
jgi:RNA polymerase sigma-70 factor (ECF subfamily)